MTNRVKSRAERARQHERNKPWARDRSQRPSFRSLNGHLGLRAERLARAIRAYYNPDLKEVRTKLDVTYLDRNKYSRVIPEAA